MISLKTTDTPPESCMLKIIPSNKIIYNSKNKNKYQPLINIKHDEVHNYKTQMNMDEKGS